MSAADPIQMAQFRLAQHYLDKVKRAEAAAERGLENRALWLKLIQQDWDQVKHWQRWSAEWDQADLDRTRLCARFPLESSASVRVRLAPSEQFDWVREALQAAEQLRDEASERELLYQLSFLSISMERPDQAEQYARELEDRAQGAQDTKSLRRAGFLLGAVAFIRGDYDRAEAEFRSGLSKLSEEQAVEGSGQLWLGLGRVENVRGNFEQARACYLKSQQAAQAAGRDLAALEATISLAGIQIALGNYPAAEAHARRAVAMARPLGRSRFLPPSLFALAEAEKAQGRLKEALTHYSEGLGTGRTLLSAPSTIANGLHGLAQCEYLLGRTREAITQLDEGLAVSRQANILLRVCELAHDKAIVHAELGELEEARACLWEALTSALQLATPHFMAKALAAALVYWLQTGRFEKAAEWCGLLSHSLDQLDPSLFDPAVFDQLKDKLGARSYSPAFERGRSLNLEVVLNEILTDLG